MPIHFSLEVNDPETENLLTFLEERFGSNTTHKMQVLRSAQQWIELKVPSTFNAEVVPDRTLRVERAVEIAQ